MRGFLRVLLEFCGHKCRDDPWHVFPPPPDCSSYGTIASCPGDRCQWGSDMQEDDTEETEMVCGPKRFCELGCEEESEASLGARYLISMYLVFGSLGEKTVLF